MKISSLEEINFLYSKRMNILNNIEKLSTDQENYSDSLYPEKSCFTFNGSYYVIDDFNDLLIIINLLREVNEKQLLIIDARLTELGVILVELEEHLEEPEES